MRRLDEANLAQLYGARLSGVRPRPRPKRLSKSRRVYERAEGIARVVGERSVGL